MDSLTGGSRLSRLPPAFSRDATAGVIYGRWLRKCGSAFVLTGVLAWVVCGSASASSYRVRSAASLQAAVASADASGSPSRIELAAGVFLPTSTLSISGDVTIVGPSSAPGTELSGSAVEPAQSSLFVVGANAKLNISNVELTAGGGAGSAAIDDRGALDLESSTIAGNEGTGVLVQSGATATVRNSTLSKGLAFGVVNDGAAGFFNSTLASNKDGGIENKGTLNLVNTIVVANRGAGDCRGKASASDHSLDSDGSCGVGALSATDPRLGALTANGGPTATQALGAGSPAIGAGDASRCPADDQRHLLRPPGRCDLGAYQTDATQPGSFSPDGGAGAGGPSSGAGMALIGVSGHGTLRGARRSSIAFSVRAEIGHRAAQFRYTDRARHVQIVTLSLRSMVIDGRKGIATIRGRGVEMPGRQSVNVTVVMVRHAAHRSLRISLSTGYHESGPLLKGSITFTQRAVR